MIGPRPVLPAWLLIRLSVAVLPADTRDRYREEFRTELLELPWLGQLGQASSVLTGSIALRGALTAHGVPVTERAAPSRKCRFGRHTYVMRQNDDPEMPGRMYAICDRCGEIREPAEDLEFDIEKFNRKSTYFGT